MTFHANKATVTVAGVALVMIVSFTATAFASPCHDSADPRSNITDNARPVEAHQGESQGAGFR